MSVANAQPLHAPTTTDELASELFAQLALAARDAGPDELVTAAVALPKAPLTMPAAATVAWERGRDSACFASGEAAVLLGRGKERFAQIREAGTRLGARIHGRHRPRFFGGFAFDDRDLSAGPWADFAPARFSLPRWQLHVDGDHAHLLLCTDARLDDSTLRRLRLELEAWMQPRSADSVAPVDARTESIARSGGEDYEARVADIVAAIRRGELAKVVAARSTEVALSGPLDPAAVVHRLSELYPECYRIALAAGSSYLIGAPPERLVRVNGLEVASEALAGSIASGVIDAAERLLASTKDRSEQELVVSAIEGELSPLCTSLEVPHTPEIRELRHLLHLRSRISGRLREPTHVIDLVARLHPTPAVGGTPSQVAQRWIAEHEREPRGWYAAPVGWFDEHGNGEFAVAIRSALVRNRRAYLFAGAGIVAASDPEAELAETILKQRAMLDALGVGM